MIEITYLHVYLVRNLLINYCLQITLKIKFQEKIFSMMLTGIQKNLVGNLLV